MKKTIFVLLGLCLAGVLLMQWYLGEEDTPVPKQNLSEHVDLVLKGVTLRQGRDGRLVWTLNATSADYHKEEGVVFVEEPHILYFQEGETKPVYVESQHGKIDQKNNQADLWSSVVARYHGSKLTTPRLHYNGTSSQLVCKEQVKFFGRDMVLTGKAAVAELGTKRLVVTGRVRAVLNMKAAKDEE